MLCNTIHFDFAENVALSRHRCFLLRVSAKFFTFANVEFSSTFQSYLMVLLIIILPHRYDSCTNGIIRDDDS